MECLHGPCTCVVAGDEDYCSDSCRQTETSGPDPEETASCFCDHPECAASNPLGGEGEPVVLPG
jgi:hypothetical protein